MSPNSPWPSFTQKEADAIHNVLLSNKVNYWTGQDGRKFEQEFATFAKTKYAVAVANGTVALDLANNYCIKHLFIKNLLCIFL